MRSRSSDNSTLTLQMQEHENDKGTYYRCVPDMDMDVSFNLRDVHIVFLPETGELRFMKNRQAG